MKYLIVFLFLLSCAETTAYKVKSGDANTALPTEVGVVIDVMAVRIQGDYSDAGAIVGGIIGGIAGEKIGSGIEIKTLEWGKEGARGREKTDRQTNSG